MKRIPSLAFLAVFLALPVMASEMYAGVSIGTAQIDSPGFDSSSSFTLLGGIPINQNFSAEIAYSNFGSESGGGVTSKSSAMSISGVGFLPINEQVSLFGKLGIASTTLEIFGMSESKSDLTFGLGGQFKVNNQVGIRAGYDVYKVGSAPSVDQSVVSISGIFSF